jgi:endonuclease/exonuclease/phosphatase family metal-dependent hydrolase
MKPERKFIRLTYALVSLGLITLLFAGLISPYINPWHFWMAALAGLAFPLIWLLNSINLLFSLFADKRIFYVTLIYMLAGTPMMLRHFSISMKMGCDEETEQFSIMSYNVEGFNGIDGNDKYAGQKIIHSYINKQAPDIVCLQEYSMKGRKHGAFYKTLNENLHLDYKQLSGYNAEALSTTSILVTASKHKIVNQGIVYSPDIEIFAIFSDILLGNDTIRVFNVHLQSVKLISEKQILKPEKDQILKKSVVRSVISSLRKLKIAFRIRSYQSMLLAASIAKSPYPVIVAGDFNDTPASFSYRTIGKSLKEASFLRTNGFSRTYVESYYPLKIDHIFMDKALNTCNFRRDKVELSDHYPVMAGFSIRPDK